MKSLVKLIGIAAAATIMAFSMAACASTIKLQVDRTPSLDTRGIKRIAIMPFTASSGGGAGSDITQYVTTTVTSKIQALGNFTLVDPSVITQLQRNNESIEGYVDALFTGQVTHIGSQDGSGQYQSKDKDGNVYTVTYYTREVDIEFNYYFTRARDGSLIGPVAKKGSTSSRSENSGSLPSTTSLLRGVVDNQLRYLNRDVAPYTVTENRKLAKETSPDKALKEQMKIIESQVKAGNYKVALDSYLDIYQRNKSIAAALNAAILYEALGNTQDAADLMQTVFDETGNPNARTEIARLSKILEDQATIAAGYGDTESSVDKVAVRASEEIRNVLPQNAKVWIVNNSAGDNMVTAVVDNVTADFIKRGVGIVDRQSAALIEAEQKFQTSGYVSDSDFVTIGNSAGANTIAVVGITGTGDMRRLQLRVLDIEKGVPIFQSDTSDIWKL